VCVLVLVLIKICVYFVLNFLNIYDTNIVPCCTSLDDTLYVVRGDRLNGHSKTVRK